MTKTLLLVFQLTCFSLFSQTYFEGTISYSNEHVYTIDYGDTNEVFRQKDTSITSFKNGNWLKENERERIGCDYQLYLNSNCTIYCFNHNDKSAFITDFINSDKLIDYILLENVDTILNIPCDKLTLHFDEYQYEFYMNSKTMKLANISKCFYPKEFDENTKNHLGIFLKAVYTNKDLKEPETIITEAIEITPKALKESLFQLPKNLDLIKD